MSTPPEPHEQVLIYDGECRLCVAAKEGLELHGRESSVRFVPYHNDEAARSLGPAYRPGRPDAAFLIEPGGRIQRGLDAFLPLLPGLPGGRILQALAHLPLLRGPAQGLYGIVARNRYRWFGAVPSPSKTLHK